MSGAALSDLERERYSRQLSMAGWSGEAQERLRSASAVVVGAGALGCPAATYLAAAGVGRIAIVDSDTVELSNLHRQPLHLTPDIGAQKADNAALKLGFLNPQILVEPFPARVEPANAEAILAGADVVVDASDSFETRYTVNDACCALGVPLVEAGLSGFSALVMSVRPGASACYRCVFAVAPNGRDPSARAGGVLGAAAGIVGSIQALEAIKLLAGVGEPLLDTILQLDLADMTQTLVSTARRAGCTACGQAGPAPAGAS